MSSMRIAMCVGMVLAAAPAGAQQNGYGGYDIVGAPPQAEAFYAETRGWQVYAAQFGRDFAYCVAEASRGDGSSVRLGWDGQQWQLAAPINANPDWEGTLQIDGAGSGQGYKSGGDYISGSARDGWAIAWLGMAELDGLKQGSSAVLGVGKFDFDFSLSGATAATLKVEECVNRSGRTNAVQPVAQASGPAEAVAAPYRKAGAWAINRIVEGRRVIACEAHDTSKMNLRFEIDADNSYIDFRDGGPMGDLGDRVPVQVLFGPGDSPTTVDVEFIEGRDGEKWARITEGRMDGPGLIDDAFQNADQVSFSGRNIILETDLGGSNKALSAFFECSNDIQ